MRYLPCIAYSRYQEPQGGPAPPPTPPPSQVRQSATSQETIGSQPEEPREAAVGAPGPAPPPPTPPPGLGPLPPGQQNTNQETHPGDVAEPWGRRRWRWHAVCRSCGKVEDSEWVFGGAPQRPVGWPKKLDMCPFCWAKSGNNMKLR